MELPQTWQFLGGMWWVLHLIAIALIFYIGYVIGKSSNESDEQPKGWASDEEKKEDAETPKDSDPKW